jgi:hypothetical protein
MPPQAPPVVLVHELVLAEHVPLVPLAVHAWPAPTHVRVAKPPASVASGMQQPLSQALAAQHGWPVAPHVVPVLPPEPPDPPPPMLASGLPPVPASAPPELLAPPAAEPPLPPDLLLPLHPANKSASTPTTVPAQIEVNFKSKLRPTMVIVVRPIVDFAIFEPPFGYVGA